MTSRLMLFSTLAAVLCAACGGASQATHVRFAHASANEIRAAQSSGEVVWYDFQPGDEVPLDLGLLGVAQAATDEPVRMVARRSFSIVVFPSGRTAFSFDGHTLMSPQAVARWTVGLGAEGAQARAAIALVLGRQQDVPPQLR